MTQGRLVLAGALSALLLGGCTGPDGPAAPPQESPSPPPSSGQPSGARTSPATEGASPATTPTPTRPRDARPGDFRVATAMTAVRHLAGRVGPRHGTSPAYRRAARWVERRLESMGYDVRRQPFRVPGGNSWGVPVQAGRSVNLVAAGSGFDPTEPHLVIGAHLDTVPQAPGAEDNASGIGVLLGVAQAIADTRTRLPVRLVAFGAEEPRGPGDDDHHYGSRHYVAEMSRAERRSLRGMVSLDRVGVGTVLPVCSAGAGATRLRTALVRAARRAEAKARPCSGNRASDHWSFVRNGLPGVRLGSTPYAAYHSAQDLPRVVNPAQLERAGRTTLAWLSGR